MNNFEFLNRIHQAVGKLYREASNDEERAHYLALVKEAWCRVEEAKRAIAPRIVFASPRVGEWFIGIEGQEQHHCTDLQGLAPAWLALAYGSGQDVVRAVDFCVPGASQPCTVVRTAIRITAASWVERVAACRPLADMMRGLEVEGGIVRYTRRLHDPEIITGI